ncbi:pilin [Marinobacter sp. S6332]|uniref:pilin n=1 Tax=Marinobacter sp. S6332 TaxID=2926403 RepID=UPI001FF635E5|nr:pilin [Marinobacter sp. S6332]MCK0163793.1 pilin [Marinobacter sp. S6332]
MMKLIKTLLIIGFIAAFSVLYSTHNNFYQGVRAQESFRYAKKMAAAISSYYAIHTAYPANVSELVLDKKNGKYVGKTTLNSQNGVIKIQLAGETSNEGVLIFSPKVTYDSEISYTCRPLNVPSKYIPEECPEQGSTQ